MSFYLKVVGLIVLFVASFGFIGPYLISAKSSELVTIGFAYFPVVFLPGAYYLIKSIVKDKGRKKLFKKASKYLDSIGS